MRFYYIYVLERVMCNDVRRGCKDMGKKEKSHLPGGIILLMFLFMLVVVFFMPQAPVKEKDTIEINKIEQVQNGELIDVTDKLDTKVLENCLPLLRCKRVPSLRSSYLIENQTYEISIRCGDEAMHIVLGTPDISHIYGNSNSICFKIQNSQAWKDLLQLLIGE